MGMSIVVAAIGRLIVRDEGQDLVEYGLLVALIVIAAFFSVSYLGESIYTLFWKGIAEAF
jgi:Flp pilus assembly pilin Flp